MDHSTIYASRAELYDLIYSFKDYRAEVLRIAELLGGMGVAPGARVLEAACGTGNHLVHLRHIYTMSGFDLHEPMVRLAARKAPGVQLWAADMADFRVDRPVDALVCLFSSIGYLPDEAALRRAARCFAAAVRPGGVLVVEPWFTPDTWKTGGAYMTTGSTPEVKAARLNLSGRDGDHSVLDMHWLVARAGVGVESFVEHHRLWLCPHPTLLSAFSDAGFDVVLEPHGLMPDRGLVIGRRRVEEAG